jgi:hypothetical protein
MDQYSIENPLRSRRKQIRSHGDQCEKRTPNTDRAGDRGAVESLNLAQIYFLYMNLRHSSWLLERKNETEPKFLSFLIPVGVFLLMAARRPSEHRSMIALAAWWNISHAVVMAIQTLETWTHNVHRNFIDVIIVLVIGGVLLALLPTNERQSRQELRERGHKPHTLHG